MIEADPTSGETPTKGKVAFLVLEGRELVGVGISQLQHPASSNPLLRPSFLQKKMHHPY